MPPAGARFPAGGARRRWAAALLLGAVGYALNLTPLALSPGTELLFGGIAALLAAVALGPVPGAVAAGIAWSRTIWLWGHPYAFVIQVLEAAAVGWLARRGRRPVAADLGFWILVGIPLLLLFYGVLLDVGGATAGVLLLKFPLNGLITALLVEGLLLVPAVRRALAVREAPGLRSALAVVVALCAVLPMLLFGVWTGRREWDRNLERTRERLRLLASAHAGRVDQHVRLHEGAIRTIADAVVRRRAWDADQLGRLVATEHQEFPGFVTVFAVDAAGRVTAWSAPTGGPPLARPPTLRLPPPAVPAARAATVVTPPFALPGRVPAVVVAHPVVLADTVAGWVAGVLDLGAFPAPAPAPAGDERLRVADAAGRTLYDSRDPYAPAETPRPLAGRASFEAVRALPSGGTTTYRAALRDGGGVRLAGVGRVGRLGWPVWVEQPLLGVQAYVADSYVRLLSILIAVTLLAMSAGLVLAGYLSLPLLRMRAAAAALGAGGRDARIGALSPVAPVELHELARDFDQMAAGLARRTAELEELGEIARSLASTLDERKVLRRVADAAVRLTEPDGCGIALLEGEGDRLCGTVESMGLLAPTAGMRVPLDGSLVGWVVQAGIPVRIDDAAADARVTGAYVDASTVGSVLCAPLVGRSGPLGTLTVVRRRGHPRPFTDADLRLLDRLARNAAVAAENAHLVARERHRAEESEAIRKVARTITAAQGLGETLDAVAREAARIVGAQVVRVALLDAAADALEVVAVAGPSAVAVGTVLPVAGDGLLEGPVRRGEAAVSDAAAAAPLCVGAETLGVLTAHRAGTAPFTAEQAALLSAFADHAAIALRNARLLEAAQAASRAKSDFIATMSHELRTPLNAVLGHLQLLEMEIHGPLVERQREALGRIEAASRHLRGLIEEVLSFARLEAGRIDTHLAETDLAALAAEVAAVIEPLAAEKALAFVSDGGAPEACTVVTDADKVRQILINLAGNAVKFTERGGVRITVREEAEGVALAVADTGPGIAAEDQGRLFQPFEQLETGFSRPHGGTGLGLYLSSQYAALLGGTLEVESEVGRGSTFTLRLPRVPPAAGGEGGEHTPPPDVRETAA